MKCKNFILTGIAMLLFYLPLIAGIDVAIIGDDLQATTNTPAKPGYKGCLGTPRAVKAYIFRLYKKEEREETCMSSSKGDDWKIVTSQKTNTETVTFQGLEEGKYKVIVLVAQPRGCVIDEDKKLRSVIYAKEISEVLNLEEKERGKGVLKSESDSRKGINVYPNPADEILTIHLKDHPFKEKVNISVFNMTGGLVIEKEEYLNNESPDTEKWIEVNTASISSGTYILMIIDENRNHYRTQLLIIHPKTNSKISPNQTTKN